MKKKCYKNIQRQLSCLIPIIESCLSLTPEIEPIKNKLNLLPGELENLKNKANSFSINSAQSNLAASSAELQKMEFELDSLVDDIELVFTSLFIFNGKLKNVAILREKLEAIQEERIDSITPERIYKLLEKQRRSRHQEFISSSKFQKNKNSLGNLKNNIWQKVIDLSHKFYDPKIAVSVAILASLSLGWIAGYYSSSNIRLNETRTVEAAKKLNDSSVDI